MQKQVKDYKFQKFLFMLKELLVSIPLLEALQQMLSYTKFIKDLENNKRTTMIVPANNIHHYSTIATRSLIEKKKDMGAFAIPCTIRDYDFAQTLYDLGISINLMPLIVLSN
ncbi:MAG: hypothetical protein Q8830_02895 [Candidatus Phytoplasma australasiaticum]|nr:hypothetical protein [Candidatus Phytoplasma australasiaticum]